MSILLPPFWLIRVAVAAVWLYEGLWCKLLHGQPHELEVVEAVPCFGPRVGALFLQVLGVVEVALAVWTLSALAPVLCAIDADVAAGGTERERPGLVAPHHPRPGRHGGQELRFPRAGLGSGRLAGLGVTMTIAETAWKRGRFDARGGPSKVLFGRMYEDAAIECGRIPARGTRLLHRLGRLHRDATRAAP